MTIRFGFNVVALSLAMWTAIPKASGADFERDVAPLLIRRCLECHNANDASGGLDLTSKEMVVKGGDGGPALNAKDPKDSRLIARVIAGEMPPVKRGHSQKLPDREIQALQEWTQAGAPWPTGRKIDLYERTTETRGGRDWWSLQPVTKPTVPVVDGSRVHALTANPVDSFILDRLLAEGMEPATSSDRETLLKRASFDLIGLPATFEEVREFANDSTPDAFERTVDRLLASPHFGERWGRYWLDAVRYADTCGYERDQDKPNAWKYRDWVIRGLNEDVPYDQFIKEQLAGDELPDRSEATVIATGFLRLGTWNDEPNDADEYKYERIEDMVHTTSTVFLGLTVKCARCHDHKFDPIPQMDYYRMAAAFWPGAIEPRGRELLGGPTKDELGFDVMGWTDVRTPPPLHLLKKGEPKHPLGIVEPAYASFIPTLSKAFREPPNGSKTTLRRLQLAEWIASPDNPLTPRVLANRLWLNHFGAGLVRSADNFGFTGDKPTHPELLDWLATELKSNVGRAGYSSQKRLHRMLVSSSTYRQASVHANEKALAQRDAANRLWWHAERKRLDSEALRDRMLVVGNTLDTSMGGPGFKPTIQKEALEGLSRKDAAWKASAAEEQHRRAVYMFSQRSLLPPLMTTFDFADTTLPCVQRPVSTVAPQALALLNNSFAHDCSFALARRVLIESPINRPDTTDGAELQARVQRLWQIALGRAPSPSEERAGMAHLRSQSARFKASNDEASPLSRKILPEKDLVLHLTSDSGIQTTSDGRVQQWEDQSGRGHHATQSDSAKQPTVVRNAIHGRPALRFDGQRRFLNLQGQVLNSQSFTLFAVLVDRSKSGGHREVFSNWDGSAGNSGTSVFLGMTGDDAVRLSDEFSGVGHITRRSEPFLLTARNGASGVGVSQNETELASRGNPISVRNLATNYVIGQQGNIDGEYWNGDIAEMIVYDRELTGPERLAVSRYLMAKYQLGEPDPHRDPKFLALASLCHVLLNTNEFAYVD